MKESRPVADIYDVPSTMNFLLTPHFPQSSPYVGRQRSAIHSENFPTHLEISCAVPALSESCHVIGRYSRSYQRSTLLPRRLPDSHLSEMQHCRQQINLQSRPLVHAQSRQARSGTPPNIRYCKPLSEDLDPRLAVCGVLLPDTPNLKIGAYPVHQKFKAKSVAQNHDQKAQLVQTAQSRLSGSLEAMSSPVNLLSNPNAFRLRKAVN